MKLQLICVFLFCNLIVGDNIYSRLNFDYIFQIKSKKIYKGNLSQSRRLPPLQVVSNSKFVSVGVQSPTEINAPRGCAVILIGTCQLR